MPPLRRCRRSRFGARSVRSGSLFRSRRWLDRVLRLGSPVGPVCRRRRGSRRSRSCRPPRRVASGFRARERPASSAARADRVRRGRSRGLFLLARLARRPSSTPGGRRVDRRGVVSRLAASLPDSWLGLLPAARGSGPRRGCCTPPATSARRRRSAAVPGSGSCPRFSPVTGSRSCACSSRSSVAAASRRRASPCSGRTRCRSSPARSSSARASRAGWRGAARIAAFALVLVGAVALSRPAAEKPVDGPGDAARLSID